jgi:hypothetical protein
MNKTILFLILVMFISFNGYADEIILNNGYVMEGNIIEVIKDKESVLVDVVIDGELIGGKILIHKDEIKLVNLDDKYKNLKKKLISQEERDRLEEIRIKRQEKSYEINDAIDSRIRRRQNQDYKKEILEIRHENRKELITHSKNKRAYTKVRVEDTNNLNPNRQVIESTNVNNYSYDNFDNFNDDVDAYRYEDF